LEFLQNIFVSIRGVTDDPAITTWVWFSAWLLAKASGGRVQIAGDRNQLVWIVSGLGLLLYPMALGLGAWDPYRDGYSPSWLLGVLGVLIAWCWARRNHLGLLLFAVALLGFVIDLKPSTNLWDYLLDPFIVFYCWGALLARGWRTLSNGKSRASRGQDRLNA
jgi:hypothetical protein